MSIRSTWLLVFGLMCLAWPALGAGDDAAVFATLTKDFESKTHPILKQYCLKCHSTEAQEGDLDLERFQALEQIRREPRVWEKVVEMLDNGEMPPKKSRQLSDLQRTELRGWVRSYLDAEARANAGDPGPVVLRRLSNVEYDNTMRDLMGIDLKPAREFPVDGAAGEGFTNVGEALMMSPAMLDKYVAAAKGIVAHAVLLPDGFRFSEKSTRRDWTDEIMTEIRRLYARYTDAKGARRVQLQGLDFQAESGGRIPLEKYLTATLDYRALPAAGRKTIADFAAERDLSPKYLQIVWDLLNGHETSPLIDNIRSRWRAAQASDLPGLAVEIRQWQAAVTKFNSVAHFKPWMEPVNPLTESQAFRVKLDSPENAGDMVIRLVTHDAGDGSTGDVVAWTQPRLESPGRPPVLLRDVQDGLRGIAAKRLTFAETAKYLAAADGARGQTTAIDLPALAKTHGLDTSMLRAWLGYLGIAGQGPLEIPGLFRERIQNGGGYNFVKGWGLPNLPSLLANSSDQEVRIPGTLKPHSVVVHPAPTQNVAAGWRSPIKGRVKVEAQVVHAHAACGNGVAWYLEQRRGRERRRLTSGELNLGQTAKIEPINDLVVEPGDLIALVIAARNNDHSCDLTSVDLTVSEAAEPARTWILSRDLTKDILASNPLADSHGNPDVWHFYQEKSTGDDGSSLWSIPHGSILDRWRDSVQKSERDQLAEQLQQLLTQGPTGAKDQPDSVLYRQLTSLSGPLLGTLDFSALSAEVRKAGAQAAPADLAYGLPREAFGKLPQESGLVTSASSVLEVRLPADLASGREFIVTATLENQAGRDGSVQTQVVVTPVTASSLIPGLPILVRNGSATKSRFEKSLDEFRSVFPIAVCYPQIVPVDEVVTLVLFHREDEGLSRLMLSEDEHKRLDRMWDQLRYISQDALRVQEAYGQFMEYVTQDGDVRIFEPLRKPIAQRAEAFQKRLIATEPVHVDSVIAFAARAYRRPLQAKEQAELRELYGKLRQQKLDHDTAFRLMLARILMAPSFLYRVEQSADSVESKPVTEWELASRLSYFLWSSMPDDELRQLADQGKLHEPEVLASQMKRMLKDERVRALATEFGCQWLDIRGFDVHNEKSEKVFPEFAGLRSAMYEESVRFLMDLFQEDESVLNVLDADYTFVNETLARFYGIPGVTGPQWRRVDGVKAFGRGGILGMASLLSKQAGASRTSPILRGNWLAEMLLGEKLPKPPKNVPILPESELDTNGLTMRQITEKHRELESCAKCHVRIDPFGFALESFDAIGRRRTTDLAGRSIDTSAQTKDGSRFTDISGLRDYLLAKRREEFVRQFCRKLLGYSLGRAVELSDQPLLEQMQQKLTAKDGHVQAAMLTLIQSSQFRERRGLASPLEQEQAQP